MGRVKLNLKGEVYGKLTVVGLDREEGKQRFWYCLCSCGNPKTVEQGNLRRGYTSSCGCHRRNYQSETMTTHGQTKTRLYKCWRSMKDRSKSRVDCSVYKPWEKFEIFMEWSLTNGYEDTKILCRNGDTGDYEPTNCRWDTHQSNSEEALSKTYYMLDPNGVKIKVDNLKKFCQDNNLNHGAMWGMLHGLQRRKSHKGYKPLP